MAGKDKKSPKVANPRKPRVVENPKVLNRTGGGTPPSQTITSPVRIAGIKRAIMAATSKFGDSPKLHEHVLKALAMPHFAHVLTDEEKQRLEQMLSYARAQVPDWVNLPVEHRPGLGSLPKTKLAKHNGITMSTRIVSHSEGTSIVKVLPPMRDISAIKTVALATLKR